MRRDSLRNRIIPTAHLHIMLIGSYSRISEDSREPLQSQFAYHVDSEFNVAESIFK